MMYVVYLCTCIINKEKVQLRIYFIAYVHTHTILVVCNNYAHCKLIWDLPKKIIEKLFHAQHTYMYA